MRKNIIFAIAIITLGMSACKGQKEANASNADGQEQRPNRDDGPPSVDEIFKLDTNEDGFLSESEVKGPLKKDFSKIDTNKDGLISREELEKAPKPKRGKGGARPRN